MSLSVPGIQAHCDLDVELLAIDLWSFSVTHSELFLMLLVWQWSAPRFATSPGNYMSNGRVF